MKNSLSDNYLNEKMNLKKLSPNSHEYKITVLENKINFKTFQ